MQTPAITPRPRVRRAAANAAQFALPFEVPRVGGTPSLKDARLLGMAGMALAEHAAGAGFVEHAKTYVLGYLAKHKLASSEILTDACKLAGIKPEKDDRAFGPVYAALQREKAIKRVGSCARNKGHGSAGGNVWALMDWKPE